MFMVPSRMTRLLLRPWRIALQIVSDGCRFPWVGWMQALISLSPCLWGSRALPPLWYRDNPNSSLNMQCFQWRRFQPQSPWPHSRRRHQCTKVILGQLAGCQCRYPAARSWLITVWAVMCLSKRPIICIFILEEEQKWKGSSRSYEASGIFTGHRHILSTPTFPLIRSPPLPIVPRDFSNASFCHTQNSPISH